MGAAYSVPIILAYNIIEASCLFGFDAYNWSCTLTFRMIWVLHDFAYFITFAVFLSVLDIHSRWDPEEYERCIVEHCNNDYYNEFYCQECNSHREFPFVVSCCILFFVTFGINIATVVMFSKLPQRVCCGLMRMGIMMRP